MREGRAKRCTQVRAALIDRVGNGVTRKPANAPGARLPRTRSFLTVEIARAQRRALRKVADIRRKSSQK